MGNLISFTSDKADFGWDALLATGLEDMDDLVLLLFPPLTDNEF